MKGKRILIIGGSGSWGQELTRQLLAGGVNEIVIFSRGEIAQVNMGRIFDDKRIKFIIGDARDRDSVDFAFSGGIDYVFHLAALKHVPICENQPKEAIYTNIIGVMNVIDAAIKHKVEKYIDVSTDKAADPTNIYGMTKAVAEKLTIQANCLTQDTNFICIRSGNVLGTSGSVVPLIIKQIEKKNEVTITNSQMTRFFINLSQAVRLLLFATMKGIGGEMFVTNMPSFYLKDIIQILVDNHGDSNTKIKEIGAREGEKIHEILITQHEITRTKRVNEDYYVILPQLKTDRDYSVYDGEFIGKCLMSSDNLRDKNYLTEMLSEGGWLK